MKMMMNFKEVMNELDYIWDENSHNMLSYPEYTHQFLPENWKVKICTEDNNFGPTAGVYIKSISMGIDWDANTILIHTDKPIWQEPQSRPVHKWLNDINGISYDCPICGGMVDKDDKFCRYCGKAFSGEIKKGIEI